MSLYLNINEEKVSTITKIASNISFNNSDSQLIINTDTYEKSLILLNIIFYIINDKITYEEINDNDMINLGIKNLNNQQDQINIIENEIIHLKQDYINKMNFSKGNNNKKNDESYIINNNQGNINKSDNIEVDLAIDDENIDYKKANIYEFDKEWKGSDGVINDNDYFYIV